MEEDKVQTELYGIISDQFLIPVDRISDRLGPGHLNNWDSIGHLQLVRKIESFFNLSFTVQDVMGFDSVGDILEAVKTHLL